MFLFNSVAAVDGSNFTLTFVIYKKVFNLGALVRFQMRMISLLLWHPFVHNSLANVTPLKLTELLQKIKTQPLTSRLCIAFDL